MVTTNRLLRWAAAACALAALAACGAPSPDSPTDDGRITVFAASSLTEAFTDIARQFEQANPGTTVVLAFGGSSTLATQIAQGAPADVFAAANTSTMDSAVASVPEAGTPTPFASNTLAIVTPVAQTRAVSSLADLVDPSVTVSICQQVVPCGAATISLFDKNAMTVRPTSEELDVKSVLSKVELGEVDAGVVYVTDARAATQRVRAVTIPEAQNVTTRYPIATLSAEPTARAFVDFVLSPAGRRSLEQAGFGTP